MKKRKLGKTDIKVSEICLGTMTWGEQKIMEELVVIKQSLGKINIITPVFRVYQFGMLEIKT